MKLAYAYKRIDYFINKIMEEGLKFCPYPDCNKKFESYRENMIHMGKMHKLEDKLEKKLTS